MADGVPMLLVCGLYQLFGIEFVTETNRRLGGLGIFEATTYGSRTRLVGNITIRTPFGPLVGFENHSGQTTLADHQQPLGQVVRGWGNNDHTGSEGAMTQNAIGTYLHGPVLPKNPALTDHLLLCALRRRKLAQELRPLDDRLEMIAASAASRRPQRMVNKMVTRQWPGNRKDAAPAQGPGACSSGDPASQSPAPPPTDHGFEDRPQW